MLLVVHVILLFTVVVYILVDEVKISLRISVGTSVKNPDNLVELYCRAGQAQGGG